MSKADFVSWDDEDLNLDLLLGDYTDYDELCDSESVQESAMYECPACQKLMKSISGFRGHVLKKHNLNLKGINLLSKF